MSESIKLTDLQKLIRDEIKTAIDADHQSHQPAPPTPPAPTQTSQTATGSPSGEPDAHNFKTYAKKCLGGCGTDNPKYSKANVFCNDCGMPMGTIAESDSSKAQVELAPCDGCGSTNGKFVR